MTEFRQGQIIKMSGQKLRFLIVSNNAFIDATGVFHVCPVPEDIPEGPLHIPVSGVSGFSGTVICERMKMIDPGKRSCMIIDSLPYYMVMNVSDAIQGIFEYD